MSPTPAAEFGQLLRSLRQAKGLSLRQVEDLTGVDRSRLSRWENGKSMPTRSDSHDTIIKLEQALGDKEGRLSQLTGHSPRTDVRRLRPSFAELIMSERTLTSQQRRALLAVYRSLTNSPDES